MAKRKRKKNGKKASFIPLKSSGPSTQKTIPPSVPTNRKNRISRRKLFWGIISLISFACTLYTFYPKIAIEIGESINPYDPFKTPFIIKNEGRLPIWNIKFQIIDDSIILGNNKKIWDNVVDLSEIIPRMNANKSFTLWIKGYGHFVVFPYENMKSADISINVIYKPFWLLPDFRDKTHFRLIKKQNGEYRWFKYPEK